MRSITLVMLFALSLGLGGWARTSDLTAPNGTRYRLRHSQASLLAAMRRHGRAWLFAEHEATGRAALERLTK